MKIIKTIALYLLIIGTYLLVNEILIHFNVINLVNPSAFAFVVIIPVFITSLSIHSLNIFNDMKSLKKDSIKEYYNRWIIILTMHKSNILKTYIVFIPFDVMLFIIMYTSELSWGFSMALFLVSSFYVAIQCFYVIDVIITRIEFKIMKQAFKV